MKVLIIGSGGREHALAWKVAQSPRVSQIFVAPGNAGTRLEPNTTNVDIAADDVPALLAFAQRRRSTSRSSAPKRRSSSASATRSRPRDCAASARAGSLPGSKARRPSPRISSSATAIPTAAYAKFTRDNFDAAWIRAQQAPLVVKADGLAAGKGVVICATTEEAVQTAQDMFAGRFGKAGDLVVVEEFLEGEEASFIAMVDGKTVLPLATSQDHKRLRDADEGPNTGGMGAYSPAPVVTPEMHERIMREVMLPTVAALAREGTPYLGFLYAGVMIHPDGTPNVLEFNCRFGDPETQPILARMRSDLVSLCEAALDGRLEGVEVDWDPRAAVGVVMAAGGYPDDVRKGDEIHGLDAAAKMPGKVFHAGTTLNAAGKVVTNGGRVLCAVGLGKTVRAAQKQAYELAGAICWEGLQYRKDIGYRAIARES